MAAVVLAGPVFDRGDGLQHHAASPPFPRIQFRHRILWKKECLGQALVSSSRQAERDGVWGRSSRSSSSVLESGPYWSRRSACFTPILPSGRSSLLFRVNTWNGLPG